MPIVNTNADPTQQYTDASAGSGFNWPGLVGGIGALGGGLAQAGAQNSSASLAQQYAAMASQLGGFGMGGPAGTVGATGAPMGAGGTLDYGNFNPAYMGLGNLSSGNVGTAGGIGAPNGLSPALQGAFNTAAGGLGGVNPYAIGASSNASLGAAANLAGQAGQGFNSNVTQQYNALQALQSPANINAANSLGNSLFGNGMLGSDSGGILGQKFGQGLAQQSAANAAAAQGLGLQAMTGSAQAATGLNFTGTNALNSAFSNFGNASMLAPNVQSSYLNPALSSITGAGNLTNTGLGVYNAGLQGALGQNQAAARAGYLGTTNANSPNQQSPYGQLLGNLFGGLATGGGSSGNILQSLFGGGNNGSSGLLQSLFGGGASGVSPANWASAYQGLDQSTGSMLSSDFSNSVGSDLSSYFGGGPSAAGGEAATGAGAGPASMIMPSTVSPDVLSGFAGAGGGGAGALGASDLSSVGLGDAYAAGMPAADAAFGGSGAAAGAGAGSVLGGAAAVAAPLALAAYGASQPGVGLGSTWYNNIGSTVGAGLDPNAGVQQKLQAASQLSSLGMMQANGTGGSSGLSTASNFDFNRLMGVLAPYGITSIAQASQLANQIYNSIPAGQMPTENSHPMVHQA